MQAWNTASAMASQSWTLVASVLLGAAAAQTPSNSTPSMFLLSEQFTPRSLATANGSTWGKLSTISSAVDLQLYDFNTKISGDGQLNTNPFGQETNPALTALPNGNFVAVWESTQRDPWTSSNFTRIYGRIITPNGTYVSTVFPVDRSEHFDQRFPAIAAYATSARFSSFMVTWTAFRNPPVSLSRVFGPDGVAYTDPAQFGSNNSRTCSLTASHDMGMIAVSLQYDVRSRGSYVLTTVFDFSGQQRIQGMEFFFFADDYVCPQVLSLPPSPSCTQATVVLVYMEDLRSNIVVKRSRVLGESGGCGESRLLSYSTYSEVRVPADKQVSAQVLENGQLTIAYVNNFGTRTNVTAIVLAKPGNVTGTATTFFSVGSAKGVTVSTTALSSVWLQICISTGQCWKASPEPYATDPPPPPVTPSPHPHVATGTVAPMAACGVGNDTVVVAWTTQTTSGVKDANIAVGLYAPNMSKLFFIPQVTPSTAGMVRTNAQIERLSNKFIVVWEEGTPPDTFRIMSRIFYKGNPLSGSQVLHVSTDDAYNSTGAFVAGLGNGFVTVWTRSSQSTDPALVGKIFSASLSVVKAEFPIVEAGPRAAHAKGIVALDDGGFAVLFLLKHPTDPSQTVLQLAVYHGDYGAADLHTLYRYGNTDTHFGADIVSLGPGKGCVVTYETVVRGTLSAASLLVFDGAGNPNLYLRASQEGGTQLSGKTRSLEPSLSFLGNGFLGLTMIVKLDDSSPSWRPRTYYFNATLWHMGSLNVGPITTSDSDLSVVSTGLYEANPEELTRFGVFWSHEEKLPAVTYPDGNTYMPDITIPAPPPTATPWTKIPQQYINWTFAPETPIPYSESPWSPAPETPVHKLTAAHWVAFVVGGLLLAVVGIMAGYCMTIRQSHTNARRHEQLSMAEAGGGMTGTPSPLPEEELEVREVPLLM